MFCVFDLGAVWPDWAKFCHFSKKLNVLGHFLRVYLVWGKMFDLLWQFFNDLGQIFAVALAQYRAHYLDIWSHCLGDFLLRLI